MYSFFWLTGGGGHVWTSLRLASSKFNPSVATCSNAECDTQELWWHDGTRYVHTDGLYADVHLPWDNRDLRMATINADVANPGSSTLGIHNGNTGNIKAVCQLDCRPGELVRQCR